MSAGVVVTVKVDDVLSQVYAEWQPTLDGRGQNVDARFVGPDSWAPMAVAERSSACLGIALELAPWRKAQLSFGHDLRNGRDERGDWQWSAKLRYCFWIRPSQWPALSAVRVEFSRRQP